MKVHFGEEKPKYIRFEGNDMFVSFDSIYWIYYGTRKERNGRCALVCGYDVRIVRLEYGRNHADERR